MCLYLCVRLRWKEVFYLINKKDISYSTSFHSLVEMKLSRLYLSKYIIYALQPHSNLKIHFFLENPNVKIPENATPLGQFLRLKSLELQNGIIRNSI